jgi:hypothetical protein
MSDSELVFIVRPLPVIKYRGQGIKILWVRIEPCLDMLLLDWDDAPVVTRCIDFGQ